MRNGQTNTFLAQAVGTVVGTAFLAAGAGFLNWTSGGGLIRLLGGVTEDHLENHYVPESAATIPSGAVLAFNSEGCPDGWVKYQEGAGRFIVGVGRHSEYDGQGEEIEGFKFRQEGGTRKHKLTIDELPEHDHAILWGQSEGEPAESSGGSIGKRRNVITLDQRTGRMGGNLAHKHMPPFVALHLCEAQ